MHLSHYYMNISSVTFVILLLTLCYCAPKIFHLMMQECSEQEQDRLAVALYKTLMNIRSMSMSSSQRKVIEVVVSVRVHSLFQCIRACQQSLTLVFSHANKICLMFYES